MNPVPRVSPAKYRSKNRAAKVRFRIKGEADGPLYEGQKLVVPCSGCGKRLALDPKSP
jgi:hypothetical protein